MTKSHNLFETIDATWPAIKITNLSSWSIRKGAGGGQRVSAATANGPVTAQDIRAAEDAMIALDQNPLFMIRDQDQALDAMLEAQGYLLHDPVMMYQCPIEVLTKIAPERLTAFPIWPPLEIISEIWTEQGIDAGRQAVMARATGPKAAILARHSDRAAGAAFVAIHKSVAMLHALEVVPDHRRQGVANNIMGVAAIWAQDNGATEFSVICVRDNTAANTLYTSLKMENVGQYHYRKRPVTG